MESEEDKLKFGSKQKIFQIFKEFLTRVAELDELGDVGSRLLTGFQHGLEFLRRPPINETSMLIESIIKANETKRFKSYLAAGCVNNHDTVQNMNKLHTCLLGLHDHLVKVKSILEDLKCLLEDATAALQTSYECSVPWQDKEFIDGLDQQQTNNKDDLVLSRLEEPEMTDYAVLMGIIYTMVKQDYLMQEKIVISLNLKSSAGELESYCLMWSLRPFINDKITHQAGKLLP